MSTYTQCLEAAWSLLDQPYLRPITEGPDGIFTELDVILLAARSATEGMTATERAEWMNEVPLQASQAMGKLWRGGDAVRYGPVYFPGAPKPDYMRVDSKIVYSSPKGPEAIETPNGTFPRISVEDDPAKSRGRRYAANRTDLKPWDEQIIMEEPEAEMDENTRLRGQVAALRRQLAEAQAENERLRASSRARSDGGRSGPAGVLPARQRRTG